MCGAGEGNRTLVSSLGSYSSTIELHPPGPGLAAGAGRTRRVAVRARHLQAKCKEAQASVNDADERIREGDRSAAVG